MTRTYVTSINSIIDSNTAVLTLDLGFHIRIRRKLVIGKVTDDQSRDIPLKDIAHLSSDSTIVLATIDNADTDQQTADLHVVTHADKHNDTDNTGPISRLWRFSAQAKHIIDGDTLDADIDLGYGISITERLRFAGIQAPAIIGIPKNAPEYARGIEARQFIEERLTANNNSFHLHTAKQGKWRRWLATIQLNDSAVSLNQELIDNNLADDWQTYQQKRRERTTVRTMFEIDRSLRSQLETRAQEQGMSMTQLIRRAIEQFIQT